MIKAKARHKLRLNKAETIVLFMAHLTDCSKIMPINYAISVPNLQIIIKLNLMRVNSVRHSLVFSHFQLYVGFDQILVEYVTL